jgi:hypothetical protein
LQQPQQLRRLVSGDATRNTQCNSHVENRDSGFRSQRSESGPA